jgi:hypothetical protein
MRRCSAILLAGGLLLAVGCKDQKTTPSGVADGSADAGALKQPSSQTSLDAGRSSSVPVESVFWVDALAVSSRVENDTAQPSLSR